MGERIQAIRSKIRKTVGIISFVIHNPSVINRDNYRTFKKISREKGIYSALVSVYRHTEIRSASKDSEGSFLVTMRPVGLDEVIEIPQFDSIDVSVIIPVYNQFDYTFNCIESVIKTTHDVNYEIILADDCSNDRTTEITKNVKGIVIARPEKNLRFTLNCNHASKYARGKYIVFLNNDTIVREGWMYELKKLLDRDPTIGLVGSKLLFPNGTLQEAGGIIWSDGSGWNYGRCQDPSLPEFNYVREVDYISGASIMIRRSLWEEIGGFDVRYAPSYCEDSDLCFEVRRHGYKVVYQPLSELYHFEGISNGTSTDSGLKSYQIVNSKKLFDKWKDVFENEQKPNAVDVFKARDRSMDKKTIVFFDETVPTPDMDAGSRTILDYVNVLLSMGYSVKMITHNFYYDDHYTREFQQMGVEMLYGYDFYLYWKKWIEDNHSLIDYVFISRPDVAEFFMPEIEKYPDIKILYNLMDLHYLRFMREYEVTNDKKYLKLSQECKVKEFYAMNHAHSVLTVSDYELKIINEEIPGNKGYLTPGFYYEDTNYPRERCERDNALMFIGGFNHTPNRDAVDWFMTEMWPVIIGKKPDCVFYIIGSNPPDSIKKYESDNVHVTGYVTSEELEDYYERCRIAVIPLRYGAGIKGKVIEALYHKIPIVATSVALEGLSGIDGYLRPCDDTDAFIDRVIKILDDCESAEKESERFADYIEEHFSRKVVEKMFNDLLD